MLVKYFILSIIICSLNANKEIKRILKWRLFHSDTYKATTADVYYKDHIINQKYFIIRIDLNSPYTEIDSNENNANINGQFIFENNIIIKMPIFYTYKINENYQNDELNSIIGLDFPKDETEEKTNFLSNLKKQNIIETKIFSLTQSSEDSKKIDIFFGTIPKVDINTNKKHFLVCPMFNKKFECKVRNIFIDDIDYEIKNSKIKFSLDERYIICPLKFLQYLEYSLSKKDKEFSNNCKINLINEFTYSIICVNDFYKKLKDIKIVFKDFSEMIFEVKNLFFERKDKTYQFIMASYKDDILVNNDFILGYNFFTIFDGVIDLEREILGIYHEKYINNLNTNNSFINYPIEIKNVVLNDFGKFNLIYMIIILFILGFIFIKYNNKKKNIKKDKMINEEELEEEE